MSSTGDTSLICFEISTDCESALHNTDGSVASANANRAEHLL